ncbi:hypothetical protein N657DRAFT_579272 [Parathielavia appendiculata]|uniref:Uncharacterized protein n=1 Tax=Parathielavia appendiculata TaxID=2587402 RepID=A0AAN6TU04_9PEZI|nr:hypothetical protein N657DRAFT_579272 [Parathielavia appendiculata]
MTALLWRKTAAAVAATATHDVRDDFVGRGRIHVLNSTSFVTASLADRIGCLNRHGMLTLRDCAVFTLFDDSPRSFYSAEGNCSFRNPNTPTNRDSYYGSDTHAWSCGGKDVDKSVNENYYTVNGFNYPFVCNGNINCWYDILMATPGNDYEPLPVWQFFWGAHQLDVPAGHSRVLWLWVPTRKKSAEDADEE